MFLHKLFNEISTKENNSFFELSKYRKELNLDEIIYIYNMVIYYENIQCKSNRIC